MSDRRSRTRLFILLTAGIFFVLTASAIAIPPLVRCTGEKNSSWVQNQQNAALEDSLFRFALSQGGHPSACEAKVTTTTDENQFGSIVYQFKGGITYKAETFPPEASEVTLETRKGFTAEAEAVRQLKDAVAKTGLRVDWTTPVIEKSGGTETRTFWDPAEGTNGRGFLTYKNGKLIAIGFGMAL